MSGAYLMQLGLVPYDEAFALQRSLAGAVSQGAIPDTVVLLEHPPVVTTGRRTGDDELHVPAGAEVEVAETNRGGKSTFHGPGQLVCYPILDLNRHGRDVKKYVRDLEEALIQTLNAFRTGRDTDRRAHRRVAAAAGRPRKIASIGVHVSRWVTTHGYALNVDLDPAPFTEWITACGLELRRSRRWHSSSAGPSRSTRFGLLQRRRSRRFSVSSSTSYRSRTATASGRRRSTVSWPPAEGRGETLAVEWTRCRRRSPSPSGRAGRSG